MALGKWIGLLAFAIALYILWQIRQVLLLVYAAVVFATALNSLVRYLQRFRIKRGFAVFLSVATTLLFLAFFVGLIVPPFVTEFRQLADLVPEGLDRIQGWADSMQTMVPGVSRYVPGIDDVIQQIRPIATGLIGNFFALFSNVLGVLLNVLLIVILTIMLLINPQPYRHGFVMLFPSFYRRRVDEILSQCEVSLVSWIIGILIDMVVIGVVSGLVLLLLGVRLVLANALLAGLLEAIPNVGPTISVIAPMAIALLDSPWKALGVLVAYILIQQLEQYLLVPFVMSRQVSLLPAITLLSQVVFAIFFGFLGLFLAIPLVIVGQIWIKEVLVHDILDRWRSPGSKPSALPEASETIKES